MRAIDFFCGAGGLTCGLLKAGIQVLAGVDICEEYRETYQKNNHIPFISRNILQIMQNDVLTIIPDIFDADDVLFAGCAPCQPFSQQRNSAQEHKDRNLLSAFGALIEQYLPPYIIVENVPGIQKKGYDVFEHFLHLLDTNGYFHQHTILNAKNYGVPQNRRRMVIIASRLIEATLPPATHGSGATPYSTVIDTIGHYPPIAAGESCPIISNHKAARLSDLNMQRIQATRHDGGSRTEWPPELVLSCHKKSTSGHTDVYGRMKLHSVAPTLTSKCFSLSNGRFGHPIQDRAISFREAAALQTFADDYVFYGNSDTVMGKQIGNAVPVSMAQAIGEALIQMEQRYEEAHNGQ